MQTTMDLLQRATTIQPSDAEWCRNLGVSRTTLTVARTRGHLTPIVAGAIAQRLELDPIEWTARAAIEAAPESSLKSMMSRTLEKVRKLYLTTLKALPTPLVV